MDRLGGKQDIRSPSPPRPSKKWSDSPAIGIDGELPTVVASRQSIGADAERMHSFPGAWQRRRVDLSRTSNFSTTRPGVRRRSIPCPVWCEQVSPHESGREDIQAEPRSAIDLADSDAGAVRPGRRDRPMERGRHPGAVDPQRQFRRQSTHPLKFDDATSKRV